MKQIRPKKVLILPVKFQDFMQSKWLLLFICVINFQLSFAQVSVKSTQDALKTLDVNSAEKLQSYLQDVHTTIYLENREMKVFGDGMPIYLKSDVSSVKMLTASNAKFNTVEFLEIRLSKTGDENSLVLDALVFKNFPKLKYLLVRSEYAIDAKKYNLMLSEIGKYGVTPLFENIILE